VLRLKNTLAFLPHFLRWGFWRKPYKLSPAAARRYAYNGWPSAAEPLVRSDGLRIRPRSF